MTGLALSDRDMLLVRDIVETCSDVSGEAELLPWQLGEELFQLIECDALFAWPCEPAIQNEDPSQDWPRGPEFAEPAPAEAFWAHFWDSDCSYPDRTGDILSVTMTSDFYSTRELPQHRHVRRLPALLGHRARADGRPPRRTWSHVAAALHPWRWAGLHRTRPGAAQPAASRTCTPRTSQPNAGVSESRR